MERKFVSKGELFVIALVLAAALFFYFILAKPSSDEVYAIISVVNYPDMRVALDENREFALPQNPRVIFRIENGAISFAASDCPDFICIRSGWLSRPGQSAACLPNRVLLTVHGGAAFDAPPRTRLHASPAPVAFFVENPR
jgi:hypothetical protein